MNELIRIKTFHETLRRKKEAERRKFLSNNFFTPNDHSIRLDPKGVPVSLLEKASSRRQVRTLQRSRVKQFEYGPYFPAHKNRCPASKDILRQEERFYTPFAKQVSSKNAFLSAAARIRSRLRKIGTYQPSFLEESTSERIELTKDAVTSDKQMAQLLYNVSKLYHSWAEAQNISKESMSKYWHGETEEYIQERRQAMMKSWTQGLENARKMLKSSKVKMMVNKRVMLRLATRINSPFWTREFLRKEQKRLEGTEVNSADHYGISVAVERDPKMHPGEVAKEYDKEWRKRKKLGVKSSKYSSSRFTEKREKLLRNKTWISDRLKKQFQEYPSLWNSSVPFNESTVYKLFSPDGTWRNLPDGDRLLKLYSQIDEEHRRTIETSNKKINELHDLMHKHAHVRTNQTNLTEVVSHETRHSMGWFNKTSGRVILGITSQISDDESEFQT